MILEDHKGTDGMLQPGPELPEGCGLQCHHRRKGSVLSTPASPGLLGTWPGSAVNEKGRRPRIQRSAFLLLWPCNFPPAPSTDFSS